MTHLTLTGYYAGTPVCGVNKKEAKSRGDDFAHAVCAPLDNPDWLPKVCPDCLEAWNDAQD